MKHTDHADIISVCECIKRPVSAIENNNGNNTNGDKTGGKTHLNDSDATALLAKKKNNTTYKGDNVDTSNVTNNNDIALGNENGHKTTQRTAKPNIEIVKNIAFVSENNGNIVGDGNIDADFAAF